MQRGPKKKPTNLKVVTGTFRKDRSNPAEPKAVIRRPSPPKHLSAEALEEWSRVVEELENLGVLSNLDRAALAAYCQAYGRWVQAEDALAKFRARDAATYGIMMKTQAGNAVQNPLVGAANKAMADMVRYATEFGMTPSSRASVKAGADGKPDPASKFFG